MCIRDRGYTVEETLGILPLYYGREATLQEQRHCLAAVSVVGWYWYVWAMYKAVSYTHLKQLRIAGVPVLGVVFVPKKARKASRAH